MKKDITTKKDIEKLVNAFYDKVKKDPEINYFFTTVVKVDWDNHLPIMYKFWENIVFYTGTYNGNPMRQHEIINKKSPIRSEHFNKWLILFNETVDHLYEGEKADLIKHRALSIATVMQIKITGP